MTDEEFLPDRRKHGYRELEVQVDSHFEKLATKMERFMSQATIAFAIIGITSAIAIFGFGFVLKEHRDITQRIQEQRRNAIRTACQAQNSRHDTTIAQLGNLGIRGVEREVTVSLIDTLAPKENCEKLVDEQVKGNG